MNKKLAVALASAIAILALGSGSLFGQDKDVRTKEESANIWIRTGGDGDGVRVIRSGGSWLGVGVGDLSEEKAAELGLSDMRGALITSVTEGSPAEKAGLQKDDVVTEFDGERVRSSAQLARLVRETPSGTEVKLTVRRGGATRSLTATLDSGRRVAVSVAGPVGGKFRVAPMPGIAVSPGGLAFFASRPRLGISGDTITGQLAEFFRVAQGKGVLISEVTTDSAAAKAGLKAGDVITKVGDREIGSLNQLQRVLGRADKENPQLTLTIVRNGAEQQVPVTLDIPEESGVRGWSWRVCGDDEDKDEEAECDFNFDFDFDFDLDAEELEHHMEGVEEHVRGSVHRLRKAIGEKEEALRKHEREIRERLIRVRELGRRTI